MHYRNLHLLFQKTFIMTHLPIHKTETQYLKKSFLNKKTLSYPFSPTFPRIIQINFMIKNLQVKKF